VVPTSQTFGLRLPAPMRLRSPQKKMGQRERQESFLPLKQVIFILQTCLVPEAVDVEIGLLEELGASLEVRMSGGFEKLEHETL
jgi:hypothetical protein